MNGLTQLLTQEFSLPDVAVTAPKATEAKADRLPLYGLLILVECNSTGLSCSLPGGGGGGGEWSHT